MGYLQYLIILTISISLFYFGYLLFFRKERNFRQIRLYLLVSVIISLILPLNTYEIALSFYNDQGKIVERSEKVIQSPDNTKSGTVNIVNENIINNENIKSNTQLPWFDIAWSIYFFGALFFIARIISQLIIITKVYLNSKRIKTEDHVIIYNTKFNSSFSFFNCIFLHEDHIQDEDLEQIISHEKIHVSQYHSFDILLIDLLSAVMWFNPFIWMMRNTIQLVHEYLADEGALSTGIDKLRYQALLVNQVTEERLICLSSSFNHSLIKKRMIMMTKSKFNHRTKLKILTLIPITLVLFVGVACVNGQNKTDKVAAVAPTKMNVLYLGVDNPMAIAVTGVDANDLKVSIDNGLISGEKGKYIVKPKSKGLAMITVKANGEVIQQSQFRVKTVPDPVAKVAGKKSGEITKSKLLSVKGIVADMENFDFDLRFDVVSFVISSQVPNSNVVREEISHSGNYSDLQIDLIKSCTKYQKLMFEYIKIKGPDGVERELSPMVFTIIGE